MTDQVQTDQVQIDQVQTDQVQIDQVPLEQNLLKQYNEVANLKKELCDKLKVYNTKKLYFPAIIGINIYNNNRGDLKIDITYKFILIIMCLYGGLNVISKL